MDVSAVLLGSNGRVRSDEDLVFFNHPAQDGVSLSGDTVTADLARIPAEVGTVVVVASVDAARPGAVFTSAPVLTGVQGDSTRLTFAPPDFTARETVVVLAEVYRRAGEWKVRAVGQGYASGLAGLATDYGVDVDPEPTTTPARTAVPPARTTVQPGRTPTATVHTAVPSSVPSAPPDDPRVGIAEVATRAPALAGSARQASLALARTGAAGKRAAVYLILGHDWYMQEMYESFAVQAFAERVLALSVSLDDDGIVPVIFSTGNEPFTEEISVDDYQGRIQELHTRVGWGWGDVAAAMRSAADHYQRSGAVDPALVIVQVGDEPWDKTEFRALLRSTAELTVFWLFVGFGHGRLAYFKNLNTPGRFSHVGFHEASKDPGAVPDEAFYDGLLETFGAWMSR